MFKDNYITGNLHDEKQYTDDLFSTVFSGRHRFRRISPGYSTIHSPISMLGTRECGIGIWFLYYAKKVKN
jgi:hypothetical protein